MDDALARADANYFAMMRTVAANITGGEVWEQDGLLCVAWGGQMAEFNVAFVTRPLEDAPGLVRKGIEFFESRSLPFVVRIREGLDARSQAALEPAGLRYSDTVPGMVLERRDVPEVDAAGLRIVRVDGPEALEQHTSILCEAFHIPMDIGRRYMPERLLSEIDVRIYVGYFEGEPVTTSALYQTHRTAGVANVATRLSARKRGFGEAMTWHAVREGFEAGAVLANLQASEMGYPIYERMGFRRVAGYRTYLKAGA